MDRTVDNLDIFDPRFLQEQKEEKSPILSSVPTLAFLQDQKKNVW